jgi:hypothetical protein
MKNIFATALISLASAISLQAQSHLFILSGQSNMAGLKPEVSFTPAVEKAFGKENVIVVKEATGGQPISRWYTGAKTGEGTTADFYKNILTKVEAAIAGKTIKTITFVWMQGERDAKTGTHDAYLDNLTGLIEKLRTDLKHKEMNFIIGRISDFGMGNPNWVSVRETQVKVAEDDPRGAWLDTDDLNDLPNKNGAGTRNDLHMSKEGYVTMGQRFAEKAIALITPKP